MRGRCAAGWRTGTRAARPISRWRLWSLARHARWNASGSASLSLLRPDRRVLPSDAAARLADAHVDAALGPRPRAEPAAHVAAAAIRCGATDLSRTAGLRRVERRAAADVGCVAAAAGVEAGALGGAAVDLA